jgi:preprotein translocase subunit YajC
MNLAHAAELAFAQSSTGGAGGAGGASAVIMQFLPIIGILAIFYFVLFRPQQRQRQERERMLGAVKKGDRVVTTSGLHGTVTSLSEHTVVLRVGDQVKLEFDRSAIGRIKPEGTEKDA